MSTRNAVLSEESLSCPVCLEIFKNPVTIACGHNFCMDCIRSCWDEDTDSDTCKCPECRQDFRPRPPLAKNIVLCKIVERMVKPGVEGSPDTVAAPGEVPCDFCTDNKLRAIKSCVVCMASFCETHLRSHYEDTVFRHHQLEDQVRDFGKRRCPEHGRALEFYCRTNQSCLCSVCAIKGHRDHDTVTVEEEVAEIKNHIEERQVELERDRQITTGEMGKLRHSVELFDEFHRRLKTEILQNFVELIENVEQAQREVIEMINTEQRNGITQANRFMNQMENKCSEVNQEKHQLDAVSKICDSFHLIQEYHRIKIVPVQQVLSHTQLTVDVKLTDLSRTVAEISNLVKNQLVKSTSENGPIADDEMEASWPLLELPTQCVSGPSEQAACQTFLPYSETPCQCTLTAGQHKDYTSTLHKASQQLPHYDVLVPGGMAGRTERDCVPTVTEVDCSTGTVSLSTESQNGEDDIGTGSCPGTSRKRKRSIVEESLDCDIYPPSKYVSGHANPPKTLRGPLAGSGVGEGSGFSTWTGTEVESGCPETVDADDLRRDIQRGFGQIHIDLTVLQQFIQRGCEQLMEQIGTLISLLTELLQHLPPSVPYSSNSSSQPPHPTSEC